MRDGPSSVAAIVEGRGLARGEIGLACIDLNRPVLCLSQFSDSQTYVKILTKIQTLQPIEVGTATTTEVTPTGGTIPEITMRYVS